MGSEGVRLSKNVLYISVELYHKNGILIIFEFGVVVDRNIFWRGDEDHHPS